MEIIHEQVQGAPSSDTSQSLEEQDKTASVPIVPARPPTKKSHLKSQISAPSYLYSLKENPAAPFKKPDKEAQPKLLIGTVISEVEAVEIIVAAEAEPDGGLKKYLGNLLVHKKVVENFNLSEKDFLVSLLAETIEYAAQHHFNAFKLACLLTVYITTHVYFKWYYWQSPEAVWKYFKKLMIRHTIEDSPDGQEVFDPEECYDIMTHFHTLYLTNLPLIHILTFGSYRLKFMWPFQSK